MSDPSSYVNEDDLEDILYNEMEGEETNISKTLQITGGLLASDQFQSPTYISSIDDQNIVDAEVQKDNNINKEMQKLPLPFPPSPYSGTHYLPVQSPTSTTAKSNHSQLNQTGLLSPSGINRLSSLGPPRSPLSPSMRNSVRIRDPPKRYTPTSFLNDGQHQSQATSVADTTITTLNSPVKVNAIHIEPNNMNNKQDSNEFSFSSEAKLNRAIPSSILLNDINSRNTSPSNSKDNFVSTYKSKGVAPTPQSQINSFRSNQSRSNIKIVSPGVDVRSSGGESPMARLRRMEEKRREKEITKKEDERTSKHKAHILKHGGSILSAWIIRKRSDESFSNAQSRWFVLGESYLSYYSNDEATEPRDVILFDAKCSVNIAIFPSPEITFHSMGRIFYLTFKSRGDAELWHAKINELIHKSQYSTFHNFGSFAPVRYAQESCVRPLVDGKETFAEISDAIMGAKEQILIGGWWVSPDVLMKRSNSKVDGFHSVKLSTMLLDAAERGVSIFILIFREMQMALGMNSQYSQNTLSALHPNIHVLRHPFNNTAPHPWSHHEKIVIIDQYISFVGGIDLCFGRYDNDPHDILFFGNDNDDKTNEINVNTLHPGIDYYNPRHSEFKEVQFYTRDLTDRKNLPRMAWHDVHCMCIGTPSRDVARHFLVRWNYIRRNSFSIYEDSTLKAIPFLLPFGEGALLDLAKFHHRSKLIGEAWRMKNQSENARILEGIKQGKTNVMVPCQVQIVRSIGQWSLGIQTEQSIQTAYCELISRSKSFIYIENQYFVSKVISKGNGKFDEAVDFVENIVANSIIERVSRAMKEGQPYKAIIIIPAYPAHSGTPLTNKTVRAVLHYQMNSIRRMYSVLKKRHPEVDATSYLSFYTLRNFAVHPLRGPVTEMLYVHSKYMCIDDEISIIGSANINDRSMSGNRDSEVCIIINEGNTNDLVVKNDCSRTYNNVNNRSSPSGVSRRPNDSTTQAISPDGKFRVSTIPGAFSKALRIRLWREHLGTTCPHKKKHKSLEAYINGDTLKNTELDAKGEIYLGANVGEDGNYRNNNNINNGIELGIETISIKEGMDSSNRKTSSPDNQIRNTFDDKAESLNENLDQGKSKHHKHKKRISTFGRFTTANHLSSFDAAIENMFFLDEINDEYFLDPLECWQNISVPMACSNTHIYNHVFPYIEQSEYRSTDGLTRDAYNYPRKELMNNQSDDNLKSKSSGGKDDSKNDRVKEEKQTSLSQQHENVKVSSQSKNVTPYPSRDPYLLTKIRGFLVNFPIDYLCEDDLSPPVSSIEYLLPSSTFT